jgi:hypothetical protein
VTALPLQTAQSSFEHSNNPISLVFLDRFARPFPSPLPKDFRACREPDTRSVCSKFGSHWLELAAITLAMAIGLVLALELEL